MAIRLLSRSWRGPPSRNDIAGHPRSSSPENVRATTSGARFRAYFETRFHVSAMLNAHDCELGFSRPSSGSIGFAIFSSVVLKDSQSLRNSKTTPPETNCLDPTESLGGTAAGAVRDARVCLADCLIALSMIWTAGPAMYNAKALKPALTALSPI